MKGRIHSLAEIGPDPPGQEFAIGKKVAVAADTDHIKALYLSPSLNINDCSCL